MRTFTTTQSWKDTDIFPFEVTQTLLANSTPYTLCDGFPRLDGTFKTSTGYRTVPTSGANTYLTTQTFLSTGRTPQVPSPACSIPSRECAALASLWVSSSASWSSAYSSYEAVPSSLSATQPTFLTWRSPLCGHTPGHSITVGPPVCTVPEASVQLLYWPVSTLGNRSCNGRPPPTMTLGPTLLGRPNTYVLARNTTLTSPTVYIR
ncbi:hypothetical protein LTR53_018329, partial [Teratosphaeriaceae sp. CCFEE 6253]